MAELLLESFLLLFGELFFLADGAAENFDIGYYGAVDFEVNLNLEEFYAAYGAD